MDRISGMKMGRMKNTDKSLTILFCLIVLFSIVSQCLSSNFLTISNLMGILRQSSHMGILAIGLTFVLITGGMDLSTGYGVTLGAIVIGLTFTQTGNAGLAIVSGIAATMLLGLCNGALITKVKVVPFVTTLATMSLSQGILNLISAGKKLQLKHAVFSFFGKSSIGGFPISVIVMFLVFGAGSLILNHTRFGSSVYACGSNEKNAGLSGIPVVKYKILVYVFSGLWMGISALIMGTRIILVTQESGGNSLMMDAIAASVIGGTDINGGKGSMCGTFLGVIFIGVINNMLVFLSIPSAAQELFKGLLIIAALFLNLLAKKEWKRSL